MNWHSGGAPFTLSMWQTAQQGSVLGLMPSAEVRGDASADGQRFLLIDASNTAGQSGIEMILNWPILLKR